MRRLVQNQKFIFFSHKYIISTYNFQFVGWSQFLPLITYTYLEQKKKSNINFSNYFHIFIKYEKVF